MYATILGSALGFLTSRLVRRALESGWAEPTSLCVTGLALPFLTYAASALLGGNGLVAAYVAGFWYANTVFVIGGGSLDPASPSWRTPNSARMTRTSW